jgi:putative cell wall-binding protein
MAEIERLGATDAIILGGPGAVSPAVASALGAELGSGHVTRIGGATRYETADLIARAVEAKVPGAYDGTAFVATGLDFPDALAGSPLAAAGPWPIFLTSPSGLSASTIDAMEDIGVRRTIVLGGSSVVPVAIQRTLEDGLGADNVTRVAGRDRYETAANTATHGVLEAGLRWNGVALAKGEDFPDALAGGPLQGRKGSAMLLSPSEALAPVTRAVLQTHADEIATVRFLGGPNALGAGVRAEVAQILQ